ncbi:vitellogenin receptor Yl-like [Styela clava]
MRLTSSSTIILAPRRCDAGFFRCLSGMKCIPKEKFCDGRRDCRDDEIEYDEAIHSPDIGVPCQGRNGKICLLPSKFKSNNHTNICT